MKKALTVICIFLGLLYLGFGLRTIRTIPKNAIVYVDDSKKVYYGLPSLPQDKASLRRTTIGEAYNRKYKPDEISRNNGDFMQEGRSVSGSLLEKVGIFPKLESRWNTDGSWKY